MGLPLRSILWFAFVPLPVAYGVPVVPAPFEPPREVVAGGLYRYSRNPMYVSVLAIVLGEALVWGSWRILAYAGSVWFAFHAWVTLYEEPALRWRFGAAYETYRSRVPRWLGWPRPTGYGRDGRDGIGRGSGR